MRQSPCRKERIVWEAVDPLGRKVRLTKDAFNHIKRCHPTESILANTAKQTIINPLCVWRDVDERSKVWYYFSEVSSPAFRELGIIRVFLMLVVKDTEAGLSIATWYSVRDAGKKGAREVWKRK